MNRSSSITLLLAAALQVAGCNNPVCGPGTKQVQVKGGVVQCQPADSVVSTADCSADAGAQLVGGICVSRITCGPNTTYDPATGVCTGTGTGGGGLPACPTPTTGHACVHGLLHNFVDNATYAGPDVKVSLYDPLAFLSGAAPIATTTSSMGGYVFADFVPPNLHLIAIAVGDIMDETTLAAAGSGAQNVVAGSTYRVDGYVIPRTVTDGWKAKTGIDYLATGAYVAKFYGDKIPPATNLAATETMKIPGVQFTLASAGNPMVPANVQYFDTSLADINPALTKTGMEGASIVPTPPGIGQCSGMGGMVNGATPTWESQTCGSAKNVIFVARYHPAM